MLQKTRDLVAVRELLHGSEIGYMLGFRIGLSIAILICAAVHVVSWRGDRVALDIFREIQGATDTTGAP